MSKELFLFQSSQNPEFLVGPRESWCFNEDLERFRQVGVASMKQMREHFPEADYPYVALLTDIVAGTNTLCFIRPDSSGLGGLRGGLQHWSADYDASTSVGLARMIYEELTRPDSEFQHMKPATCILNFIGDPVLNDAFHLLKNEYGYEIKKVEIE